MPKSASRTRPSPSMSTLAGLMSRWTTPWLCTYVKTSASCLPISVTRDLLGRCDREISESELPSISSITKNVQSSPE